MRVSSNVLLSPTRPFIPFAQNKTKLTLVPSYKKNLREQRVGGVWVSLKGKTEYLNLTLYTGSESTSFKNPSLTYRRGRRSLSFFVLCLFPDSLSLLRRCGLQLVPGERST